MQIFVQTFRRSEKVSFKLNVVFEKLGQTNFYETKNVVMIT